MNGFTFYICIGKYGGFTIEFFNPGFGVRIVMGWVSFCIGLFDIERDVAEITLLAKQADKGIRAHNEGHSAVKP